MSKPRSNYNIINKKISVVILGVLAFTINSDLSRRTTPLLFAIHAVAAQDTTSNPQFTPSSAAGGGIFPVSSGPIHDSSCDVEQLERANDSQLYLILNELRKTAFFRTFAVDLEQKCPVSFASSSSTTTSSASTSSSTSSSSSTSKSKFGGNNNNTNKKNSNGFSSTSNKFSKNKKSPLFSKPSEKKEDTEKCTGVLPDADPDAKPACSIDTSGTSEDDSFFLDSFNSNNKKSTKATTSSTTTTTIDIFQKASETAAKDESDDEFQCDGGADELDDDAPPLCSVESSLGGDSHSEENLFPLPPSLSHKSEKEIFSWDNPSDPVIDSPASTDCNDDAESSASTHLPDRFWTDICSNIKGSNLKPVNLQLNPERNTGYNGTHIWNAIYEENCLNIDTEFSDMCFEERVLYRLISGLHTSTTLSIAKHYYPPSKRKNRENWEANPKLFYEKFISTGGGPQGEEYIRNLYFSYVVLLRALHKAHDFLYLYEIRTGNVIEDQTATILLKRLLDTKFLDSCNTVFESFDESLMFQEDSAYISSKDEMLDMDLKEDLGQMFTKHSSSSSTVSLKQNFKGVFHNISSVLDCVQCQQCKLHGKMAMLGYGTALKILFLNKELIDSDTISRNEIVAFINTLAKMSDGMKDVKDLTQIYWASNAAENGMKISSTDHSSLVPTIEFNTTVNSIMQKPFSEIIQEQGKVFDLVDEAIKCISKLASLNRISSEREEALVRMAFEKDPNLLILSKYYSRDLEKFEKFSSLIVVVTTEDRELPPDAIVIGGGLAGLAATLNILDRGGTVTLIEKEHVLGGNSAKASSGINACCPHNNTYGDEVESFMKDTVKSAGDTAQLPLISKLVGNSEKAVTWLKDRVGVDLSLLAQLGGHSHKRTHRPSNGMAGAEIIFAIQKAVRKYEKSGKVKIFVDSKVTQLITNDDDTRVIGVEYQNLKKASPSTPPPSVQTLLSPNIILTTGGFAADRTPKSYLDKYRPELMNMPATAGEFSTGDGISLATSLGAGMVDMDKIQIHPTGWVDPKDPENPNKVLAAELMRGVGGILINEKGKRFCNELGTRAYVTDMMLNHDPDYASEGKWNVDHKIPTFSLVLSSSAALDGQKHVNLYQHKGLLTKIEGIEALANWMNFTKTEEETTLRQTMIQYQSSAKQGKDEWGKVSFRGVPSPDLENETFYVGTVTPVLHYCMGGVTIDEDGNVLNENQEIIHGLHAAGEVSGGVHGNNRLGGNSLLECTVYGTIIGQKIPIQSTTSSYQPTKDEESFSKTVDVNTPISMEELSQHDSPEDCWVAIHGTVYDLTDFAEEHPPGAESIHILAGKDGTEAFQAVHNMGILEEFEDVKKGILVA